MFDATTAQRLTTDGDWFAPYFISLGYRLGNVLAFACDSGNGSQRSGARGRARGERSLGPGGGAHVLDLATGATRRLSSKSRVHTLCSAAFCTGSSNERSAVGH